MIKIKFSDGCTGNDDEPCTITAPSAMFRSFCGWADEGIIRMAAGGRYNPNPDMVEALRLIRDRELDQVMIRDRGMLASRHWVIKSRRSVVDWYMIFYETNRRGVPYRTLDQIGEPVWEVVVDGNQIMEKQRGRPKAGTR